MNYYDQIKGLLISNEIYKKVKDYSKNKSDVETYYNVGKLIIEAQGGEKRAKYGDGLIKEYSERLIIELNDKKYSEALDSFASLRPSIDAMFDSVMVMDKDEAIKNNRLGLLKQIYDTMLSICDLSKIVYK